MCYRRDADKSVEMQINPPAPAAEPPAAPAVLAEG